MNEPEQPRHKKVRARSLCPGDLIFSPRTEQLMFVLSVTTIIVDEGIGDDPMGTQRIQISWLPLKKSSIRMETNVNPDIIYLRV